MFDYDDIYDEENWRQLQYAKDELIESNEVIDFQEGRYWMEAVIYNLFKSGNYEDLINSIEELAHLFKMSIPENPDLKFKFKTQDIYKDLIEKLTKDKEKIA